jgi:tetratricopeptide (TPR) repeat protein
MQIGLRCIILLSFPLIAGGPTRWELYSRHLAKGDEFYHSFDNERALGEYKQAHDAAPDSFATIERLVSIYNDMGRLRFRKDTSSESFYRLASAYADSLSMRFPERAESHFWLALCKGSLIPFLGTRQKILTARAVQREANRAIEIDSGFSQAFVILGIFEREASNIGWFERVLANVVFGADFSGSLTSSEAFLRRSVSLNPSNSYGYYELFLTYRAMKDTAKAVQSIKQVLTLSPTNARELQQMEEAKHQFAVFTSGQ